jgi:hypothetical protein
MGTLFDTIMDRFPGLFPDNDLSPLAERLAVDLAVQDAVPLPLSYEVTRGAGGPAIAYVIATSATVHANPFARTITFTDGSLWLVGAQLDPLIPADGFVGIAFATASLVIPIHLRPVPHPLPGPHPRPEQALAEQALAEQALAEQALAEQALAPLAAGAAIVVPFGTTAALTVQPGPSVAPSGDVDDDGAAATVAPPASASFDLSPDDGTVLTSLGDAAVTVYGGTAVLSGGASSVTFDAAQLEWVVGFATTSGPPVNCDTARSAVFRTSGSAPLLGGSWRLPVVRTTADRLGDAAGATIGLSLGAGLSTVWGHLSARVPLVEVSLAVRDGWLQLSAGTAAVRPMLDTYTMWEAGSDPDHPRPTSVTLHGSLTSTVTSTQSAASDVVRTTGCALEAHLDRPCLADGNLPRLDRLTATYTVGVNSSGPLLAIIATGSPNPYIVESYMLRNVLLRTDGLDALVMFASLDGSHATSGTLILAANLLRLTPTLPDPYAASLSADQQQHRTLLGGVVWTETETPKVQFEIVAPTVVAATPTRLQAPRGAILEGRLDTLYDVSSASDQLGVTMLADALAGAQIDGQTLGVSGETSALYALPQIAWEAVITEDSAGDRFVFPAFARNDGPSVNVNVATQELRPMTPDAFLDQFLTDFDRGADLVAHFTLPFGLEAEVFTVHTDPPSPAARPSLSLEAPDFGVETGGRQLAIAAPHNPYVVPVLPGRSFTTPDPADVGYPEAILDADIASFWNQKFQLGLPDGRPFVPLDRIALSGYGTSTFSDYLDRHPDVGVSEARFDVIVGRTSYALIQIQSMLCPWGVIVVNTTIFERDGAGWVQRRNTGWRAKSPGLFSFTGGPAAERGGVAAVLNVRNIVELGVPHVTAGVKDWSQVSFDTDVALFTAPSDPRGLTIQGGDNGLGQLAGTRFAGWIDLTVGALPTLGDVIDLMDVVHTADGRVAAEIVAGSSGPGTGIAMTLTGVDVAATVGGGLRTLGVALRGLPRLPRDGSWSVAKRTSSQPTPSPVDPLTPVPLVRYSGDQATWHLAEPADVVNLGAPATLYAIVQSTGTQKVLFEHPTISNVGQTPLTFVQTPKLADVGALLGSGGLLPNIASLLDFPSFGGFTPAGDGLHGQTLTVTTQLPDTTLIPVGPISVVLGTNLDPTMQPQLPALPQQSVITVVIDPTTTPRWSIEITNVAFKLLIDGSTSSDPLVAVIGDLYAADGAPPTVKNLQFAYGSQLTIVKQVLSGIEALAAALPGGGVSGLDVGFTGTKLRVRDAVSLPQLPLGLGYLQGISLDLGFEVDILTKSMTFNVGVGSDQNPFTWLASPLAGNGLLQLGAGDAGLGVRMQGGIGVGLGIDLAIASGSASVCIAVQLDTTKTPFGIMVLLTGNAAVDVLDGLASASLTLTAGLGVQVSPGPPGDLLEIPPDIEDFIAQTSITLTAEVAVAIHLSVCWLVHVDWSGSWSLSETVSGSALTSLLP